MDAVGTDTVREVAEEGRRLIDLAWRGELTRDEAVHRFVQVGDGMVCAVTAGEIVDDGVRRLNSDAARVRILTRCALFEVPLFGGFAVLALAFGDHLTCVLSVALLVTLQLVHRTLPQHPPSGR